MPNKVRTDKHLAPRRGTGRGPGRHAPPRSAGQALDALLTRRPQLAAGVAHAAEKTAVIDALRALLPADLAAHAIGARMQRSDLLVTADTAGWSGRLRYATNAALPELQRRWPALVRVRLRVAPPVT